MAAAFSLSAAAPPEGYLLALRLQPGERIQQRSDLVDRIQWVLPQQRLDAFIAQGVVINEEVRTTTAAMGVVTSSSSAAATLEGSSFTTVRDIPRHRSASSSEGGVSRVTPRNVNVGTTVYAIESAPMVDLPDAPVTIGSRWTTRQQVLTTLGSGIATFDHVVTDISDQRVRVDVTGHGDITGKEYNLPHLLPGTISLTGSAWFDLESGLVALESYRIENTLIKPAGGERIGFLEVLDASIDVRKESQANP
jgi:hypothetical protein